jgi:hypothetical protein
MPDVRRSLLSSHVVMKSARHLPVALVGVHTIALTIAILILPTVPRSESIALLVPQPAHGVDLSGPYRLPVAYSFVAERVFTLHKYPQPFRLLFLPELAILAVGHILSLLVFLFFPGIAPWHLSWLHFAFLLAVGGAQWWLVGFITAHWLPSSRRLASGRRA